MEFSKLLWYNWKWSSWGCIFVGEQSMKNDFEEFSCFGIFQTEMCFEGIANAKYSLVYFVPVSGVLYWIWLTHQIFRHLLFKMGAPPDCFLFLYVVLRCYFHFLSPNGDNYSINNNFIVKWVIMCDHTLNTITVNWLMVILCRLSDPHDIFHVISGWAIVSSFKIMIMTRLVLLLKLIVRICFSPFFIMSCLSPNSILKLSFPNERNVTGLY